MGECKFQVDWLRRTDTLGYAIGAWCGKSTEQENQAFCSVCAKSFSHAKKGIQDLLQHSSTVMYSKSALDKLHFNQLWLKPIPASALHMKCEIFRKTNPIVVCTQCCFKS